MASAEQLPAWQAISHNVSDLELHPYLVRLAVLANLLTEENARRRHAAQQPAAASDTSVSVGRLPKNSIKGLRAYFKQLALDKQTGSVNPQLKRTYLAFYAQLLEMKISRPENFADFERSPELLLAQFLAIVSKLAGPAEVPDQGAAFVSLLRSVVKRQGGSAQLDAQLQASEAQLKNSLVDAKKPKEEIIPADCDGVASQIANVMLVSPTLFARDLAQEEPRVSLQSLSRSLDRLMLNLDSGLHPVYQPADFPETWDQWCQEENKTLQTMRKHLPAADPGTFAELIPPEVRSYFTLLLRHCIDYDRKASTLFSNKTLQMLRFVAQRWRITPPVFATCLIAAMNYLYARDEIDPAGVLDTCTFIESTNDSKSKEGKNSGAKHVALADRLLAQFGLAQTKAISVTQVQKILTQIFAKPPKMGVYLQIIDTVPEIMALYTDTHDKTPPPSVTPAQVEELRSTIVGAAEAEYDRLVAVMPRDGSLNAEHITDLVHAVIAAAEKLQKRYKQPLLGVPIALVACRVQVQLLSADFVPLWQHCLQQCEARQEEPPFDVMLSLHDDLLLLQDLYAQVSRVPRGSSTEPLPPCPFDAEHLLFPYFEKWALDSAALANDWVKPALEQDDGKPVDRKHGMLYTSVVKDLFRSFHSFLKLIEDLHWQDPHHVARLYTVVIGGVSSALCDWASHVQTEFYAEMDRSRSGLASSGARLRAKEQDEEWLAYVRETTAQAKAVLAATQKPSVPPFEFRAETGAKINNVDAAYEMLHQMESKLNSDQISRNTKSRSAKRRFVNGNSFLFTVTMISATDLNSDGANGVYVTLADQDTRKPLGKTRTSFGSSRLAAWNEPIELEVGKKPRLLKATVWAENGQNDHVLCGRVSIRLDAKDFSNKEYGMQLSWLDLESGTGKLQVMVAADALQDDIRFHFGKSLRFLMRVKDSMITSVVEQFSQFIYQVLSRSTLRQVTGGSALATSVDKLQKSFNNWLGKSLTTPAGPPPTTTESVEDILNPLYDYLNRNFGILAGVLTEDLRKDVLAKTWDVVLQALEQLIIPPLHSARKIQTQLSSAEMEAVYTWLSCLRDFFYSGGAGPSLERLQNDNYQLIMAIPVYYDLPTTQLKLESEKIARGNSRLVASSDEMVARQRTVMAHRNKSVIEHQTSQLRNAQRTVPRLDDVILRILRLRDESKFIDQHLRYRERLLQREMTERALQGSIF